MAGLSQIQFRERLEQWGRDYRVDFDPSGAPRPASEWTSPPNIIAQAMLYGGSPPKCGSKPPPLWTPSDDIEDAVMRLWRFSALRATALRARYCARGTVRDRLAFISHTMGENIGRTKYFAEADVAESFVFGVMTARELSAG